MVVIVCEERETIFKKIKKYIYIYIYISEIECIKNNLMCVFLKNSCIK